MARLKWPLLAALLALVPVGGVFSLDRVFCVRDLALFFWGRQLFLRRALLSGHWPLWDPYVGGGQSAVADGLHQMFLLPVLALRLLGTEVVGFNLWVALPFPVAALGAWLFLRRRFSAPAAAFGAIAFAVSGPVVSTGNFPNLSWSVAAMPWVMWAVEHCLEAPSPRSAVRLALAFGFQALSGEPVTLSATALVALVYALVCAWSARRESSPPSALASVVAGLVLGGLLSAVQLVPMADAVRNSWRPYGATTDFWSLHPLALAETLSVHLTGDYFESVNFLGLPWMLPLNSGRDPFFFSIYLGTTLLGVALFGALAGRRRVPVFFWVAVLVASLLAAFGPHTPFYPFLRAHAPLVGSFRFPVKYLLVAVLALSVLVAAGWDAMTAGDRERSSRRHRLAQWSGPGLALAIAAVAYVLSALALYFPATAARQYFDLANWVGIRDPVAAARFMLGSLPAATSRVVLLSLACALFLAVGSSRRREARPARMALLFLLAVDLTTSAWGINATFEAKYLQDPAWTSIVRRHPDTRFYFGGKVDGTLREKDPDGAKRFRREPGLSPVEARSTLANEPVFFPAARQVRELFSFDLAVLWPRAFQTAHSRFLIESREGREHFLDNAGVRFRMLPADRGEGHPSVGRTRYCERMQLFDWGPGVNRASVVTTSLLVPDARRQIDGMFDPAFDARRAVMVASVPAAAAGVPGSALPASARILSESTDAVRLEATVPAEGGYLVLLDTYTPDWKARADGADAEVVRANALFRAIRLAPGRHTVEFRFRPTAFYYGAALSLVGVILCAAGCRRRAAPAAGGADHKQA